MVWHGLPPIPPGLPIRQRWPCRRMALSGAIRSCSICRQKERFLLDGTGDALSSARPEVRGSSAPPLRMARYDRGDAGNFPGGRHFPPERATGRCRSSWDHGRACRDASTHRHPCPPSQGFRAACRSSDGRDLVGIAAGVDGGTGPRVGLAVQRRHFSERGGRKSPFRGREPRRRSKMYASTW